VSNGILATRLSNQRASSNRSEALAERESSPDKESRYMGLFDALTGRTKLMAFRTDMAAASVAVGFERLASELSTAEAIRLWTSYQSFLIFGFGGPNTESGSHALALLALAVREPFDSSTDCFARVGWSGVMRYVPEVNVPELTIRGALSTRGAAERRLSINGRFPFCGATEKHYSALALLQAAVEVAAGHEGDLRLFATVCRTFLDICPSKQYSWAGLVEGVKVAQEVADVSYHVALQLWSRDSEGKNGG
jgi:hypothetical protein